MSDYRKKINALLLDKAYTRLNKNPTNTIAQKTKILEKSNIFSKIKLTLKPINPLLPRLYSQKNTNPIILSIVSAINSSTYDFSRFLAQELKPLIGKYGTHIVNSTLHSKNPIASCRHTSEFRCRIPLHTDSNQRHQVIT